MLVQRVDKGGASQSLQAALPALTGLDGNVIQPSGSQQAQPRYNTRSQNQTQQAKTVDLQEEVEEEDDEEMEKKEFDQGDKVKKQKKMQRKLIRPGDWQKLALKLLNELIQVEDEENQEIHNDILQRMLKVGAYPIVSFINLTLDSLSLIIVTLSVCLTWKGPKVKSTNDWMDCINASLGANGVEEENMHHYKQYILHLHWVLKSFDEEYAAIDPLLLTPDWHSEAVKILGEGKASADVDDDEEEKGGRVPSDDIGMAIDGDKGERESEEEEKQVQEGEKESHAQGWCISHCLLH